VDRSSQRHTREIAANPPRTRVVPAAVVGNGSRAKVGQRRGVTAPPAARPNAHGFDLIVRDRPRVTPSLQMRTVLIYWAP